MRLNLLELAVIVAKECQIQLLELTENAPQKCCKSPPKKKKNHYQNCIADELLLVNVVLINSTTNFKWSNVK